MKIEKFDVKIEKEEKHCVEQSDVDWCTKQTCSSMRHVISVTQFV